MATTSRLTVLSVELLLTADDPPPTDYSNGARGYAVATADGVHIGRVERRVERAWRKVGRLRTDTRGYSRWWQADTTPDIAQRIADDDDRQRRWLPTGLVGNPRRGVYLTGGASGSSLPTRREALELVVAAARDGGLLAA